MARHISVYCREDLAFIRSGPDDVYSPEFDRWSDEANRRCLYDAPLGSEAAVREFWSVPGEVLGLPLVTSIYERGFHEGIEWSGSQLDDLDAELLALERRWNSWVLPPDVAEYLQERLASVRAAVELARQSDGVLTIT